AGDAVQGDDGAALGVPVADLIERRSRPSDVRRGANGGLRARRRAGVGGDAEAAVDGVPDAERLLVLLVAAQEDEAEQARGEDHDRHAVFAAGDLDVYRLVVLGVSR